MQQNDRALKAFLRERMYRHYKLNRMTSKARRLVKDLFQLFVAEPECLPTEWRRRTDGVPGAAGRMEAAEAARLARLARACREPALAGLRGAVTSGAVGVVKGALIGDLAQEARPLADPGALDETVATLVRSAPALTVPQLRTAVRYALNHLRPAADLEREADVQRASRLFHRTGVAGTGMCEYRLVLDPVAAAIVDAAVVGLSRPEPGP